MKVKSCNKTVQDFIHCGNQFIIKPHICMCKICKEGCEKYAWKMNYQNKIIHNWKKTVKHTESFQAQD